MHGDWTIGHSLLGEFTLERELGSGAFGRVYLTRNSVTGERYAVKKVHTPSEQNRQAFLVELQSWVDMPRHSHIASCRFFRTNGDDVLVFAEYVDGGSLLDWIAHGKLSAGGKKIAMERILGIAMQAAQGLDAAHQRGLVHQDFKPSNLLLTSDGVAKVTDFGLARYQQLPHDFDVILDYFTEGLEAGGSHTPSELRKKVKQALIAASDFHVENAGTFTRLYASPEQMRGQTINARSDVWSWGATLLHMLLGSASWNSVPELLSEVDALKAGSMSLEAAAPGLVNVLHQALRQEPAERWPSLALAAAAMNDVFRNAFGRPYLSEAMREDSVPDKRHNRRLPSGGGWSDPLFWLMRAYHAAGRNLADAGPFYPRLSGSLKAQAVADLRALNEARAVFAGKGSLLTPDERIQLGSLHAEIAAVHESLGDMAGALDNYGQCRVLLSTPTKEVDLGVLLVALNNRAVLLRRADRNEEAMAACREVMTLCERLPRSQRLYKVQAASALLTLGNATEALHERLRHYDEALELLGGTNEWELIAKVHASTAAVFEAMGSRAQATAAYESAATLLTDLIKQDEQRADLKYVLVTMLRNRTSVAQQDQKWEIALQFAEKAVSMLEPLVKTAGHTEYAGELGEIYFTCALAREAMGLPFPAIEAYKHAADLLRAAVVDEGRTQLASKLGDALRNHATILLKFFQTEAALSVCQYASSLWQNISQHWRSPEAKMELARVELCFGTALGQAQRLQAAAGRFETVIAILRDLEQDELFPLWPKVMASALMERGILARRSQVPAEAVHLYREALEVIRPLGDDVDTLGTRALIFQNMANALMDAGEYENAEQPLEQSTSTWVSLAEAGYVNAREELALTLQSSAGNAARLGLSKEVLRRSAVGLTIFQELIAQGTRDDLLGYMARMLWLRGRALVHEGEPLAAIQSCKDALNVIAKMRHSPQREMLQPLIPALQERRKSLAQMVETASKNPMVTTAKADSLVEDGKESERTGQALHACEFYSEAIGVYRYLMQVLPDAAIAERLASTQLQNAVVSMFSQRTSAAAEAFSHAIRGYDALLSRTPRSLSLWEGWVRSRLGWAMFLKNEGQIAAAREAATVLKTRLTAEAPREVRSRYESKVEEALCD
ncbi:serine/threonine-protein kinase [Corallococcus sp. AB049A]|uniref:serine/threonine-protein kinase n=1 Tax=Corallococcus sp. AB049A TaxID=2316721 RepID=UPI0013156F36|nr:serine/threonine-protein kinase [Corallococcus sp. AB049A]